MRNLLSRVAGARCGSTGAVPDLFVDGTLGPNAAGREVRWNTPWTQPVDPLDDVLTGRREIVMSAEFDADRRAGGCGHRRRARTWAWKIAGLAAEARAAVILSAGDEAGAAHRLRRDRAGRLPRPPGGRRSLLAAEGATVWRGRRQRACRSASTAWIDAWRRRRRLGQPRPARLVKHLSRGRRRRAPVAASAANGDKAARAELRRRQGRLRSPAMIKLPNGLVAASSPAQTAVKAAARKPPARGRQADGRDGARRPEQGPRRPSPRRASIRGVLVAGVGPAGRGGGRALVRTRPDRGCGDRRPAPRGQGCAPRLNRHGDVGKPRAGRPVWWPTS